MKEKTNYLLLSPYPPYFLTTYLPESPYPLYNWVHHARLRYWSRHRRHQHQSGCCGSQRKHPGPKADADWSETRLRSHFAEAHIAGEWSSQRFSRCATESCGIWNSRSDPVARWYRDTGSEYSRMGRRARTQNAAGAARNPLLHRKWCECNYRRRNVGGRGPRL